jgi:hypothetical protein
LVKNVFNDTNTEGVDMALDQDKLQRFLQKALDEIGATFHASLVVIGDQLGLYKAMAGAGPLTSVELAERTNTAQRGLRGAAIEIQDLLIKFRGMTLNWLRCQSVLMNV